MTERVVGGGILPHQVHRRPLLLDFLRIEIEPREAPQFGRKLRVLFHRELGVEVSDRRTRAAAAAVAKQRKVLAGLQSEIRLIQRDRPEFDEMVSASTRT